MIDFSKINFSKWLPLFKQKPSSASIAKERLQIIVSHESARTKNPDFIRCLQEELLAVISKYVHIDPDLIRVQLERSGDSSILELNVTLPDAAALSSAEPVDTEQVI
jgi:cell division topological specificity factor